MIVILSPAKKLDVVLAQTIAQDFGCHSEKPYFFIQALEIMKELKRYDRQKLAQLMGLSDKLASLNVERNQEFHSRWQREGTAPAVFVFQGDTYRGLDSQTFSAEDLDYAQDHLRIMSGLYGVLSPLDGIQPYRLEMGCGLSVPGYKNLVDYWQQPLGDYVKALQQKTGAPVIQCASQEYFAPLSRDPEIDVIHVHFKEVYPDGQKKTIGLLAKKARGRFARFVVQQKIENREDLKSFDSDGYKYQVKDSDFPLTMVFARAKT
ncbi:MAG: YaaA family protein [Proteobacteria bacterium]|nr:YaaA family protein [Pseudomonadota bacterium]